MFTRLILGASVLAAALLPSPVTVTAVSPSEIRASLVTFPAATRVCGHYLVGQYVVVHDDGKMARGEPCTTFYRLGNSAAAEPAVSFHCIPRQSDVVETITLTTRSSGGSMAPRVLELVEYQFAGDTEAHGVPR